MPIFDQGYQHWTGQLTGHAWRWLAITRQGVRIGLKNRYLRMVLMLAWLPAIVLVAMLCIWGLVERNSDLVISFMALLRNLFGPQSIADPKHYRVEVWTICYHYFLKFELWFSLLLILLVGPNLISADLRFNALPLYLSRPLRRIDYFLGKLGIIVSFIALITIVPAIIAYFLGLLFSLDITIIKDTYRVLLASVLYGFIIAVSAGLLILALSSISRNSRYVALFWIAMLLIGGIVSTVLQVANQHQQRREFYRENGSMQNREALVSQQIEAMQNDWRPVVSYSANLSRIGEHLLGTNKSWEELYRWMPEGARAQFLYNNVLSPRFPWYWSAAVLFGIFGLSAWILNKQIKSLDRLK